MSHRCPSRVRKREESIHQLGILLPPPIDQRFDSWGVSYVHSYMYSLEMQILTADVMQGFAFPGCAYTNSEQVPTVDPAWAFTDKAKGMK